MDSSVYSADYFKEGDDYEKRATRLSRLYRNIRKFDCDWVLDVGCGQGYLVDYITKNGKNAVGVDISKFAGRYCGGNFVCCDATQGLPFPNDTFDVVVSADFFEHLPEDKIDFVYSEMKRVGKHIIAWICYKQEKRKLTKPSHLTVKPREWWQAKLPGVILL